MTSQTLSTALWTWLSRHPLLARVVYGSWAFSVALPGMVAFAVLWLVLSDEGQ